MGLWKEYKEILKDDFSKAISKVREHGFYEPGSSGCPLTDALCRILEVHFELQNKLNKLTGEVKALKWNAAKKDEIIGALQSENAELQKLKRFETMTSDETYN